MFFFSISFLMYFGVNTNLAYVSKLGEEGLVFYDYLFTSQRESHSLPDRDFFCYTVAYFVPFWVIENRVTSINFKYFNGNCDSHCFTCLGWSILFLYEPAHNAWLFSYGFKITCILLRQVISLKKIVVLSAKFTILIWCPICIPLILLSALTRLASTSAAVLYNNLDSWHHWGTHIEVKGSNRRPFILILDSILVYAT